MYIRILILRSRALTTITLRIERDVKKSGIMQQYSGTPGVKSNFRDYPGKSGRVGRSGSLLELEIDLTQKDAIFTIAHVLDTPILIL